MGIYQGLSEYKPDAQASASILAYTRLRFGLVLVRNYLPLALAFIELDWSDQLQYRASFLCPNSSAIEAVVLNCSKIETARTEMRSARACGVTCRAEGQPHASVELSFAGKVEVPESIIPFQRDLAPSQRNLRIGVERTDVWPRRWTVLLGISYGTIVWIGRIAWPSI